MECLAWREEGEKRTIWVGGKLSLRCQWLGPPDGEALVFGNKGGKSEVNLKLPL